MMARGTPSVGRSEVAARRQRFVEAGGVAARRRPRIGRCSRRSWRAASSCPTCCWRTSSQLGALIASPWLRRPKPAARGREEAQPTGGAADFRELQKRLRQVRGPRCCGSGRARLAGGRPGGGGRAVGLAEGCLEAAVAYCDGELRGGFGAPLARGGARSFVVLGMGKLGGEELNFSSDVDLVYLYSTDDGAAGSLTLHEYFARLSQMVTRALGERTEGGMVFRVDLRLRPEGRWGDLQLARRGRALLRDLRAHLGAAGAAARAAGGGRRGPRRAVPAHGRAVRVPALGRGGGGRRGAWRCASCSALDSRARRRDLRREAGPGRDPRRRAGRAALAAPARGKAPRAARAEHAAGAAQADPGRAGERSGAAGAGDGVPVPAPGGAPNPARAGRPAARAAGQRGGARAARAAARLRGRAPRSRPSSSASARR